MIYSPEADTPEQAEVRDEWRSNSSHPDVFSQYPFFRQHMDGTLKGRSVNNGLDAVTRTAEEYTSVRLALWDDVDRLISQALERLPAGNREAAVGSFFRQLEPSEMNMRTSELRASIRGTHVTSFRLFSKTDEWKKRVPTGCQNGLVLSFHCLTRPNRRPARQPTKPKTSRIHVPGSGMIGCSSLAKTNRPSAMPASRPRSSSKRK